MKRKAFKESMERRTQATRQTAAGATVVCSKVRFDGPASKPNQAKVEAVQKKTTSLIGRARSEWGHHRKKLGYLWNFSCHSQDLELGIPPEPRQPWQAAAG